jgi:ribosomal protein L32
MAVQKSKKSASKKLIKVNYFKFKQKNKNANNNLGKSDLFKVNINKKFNFINAFN